jgi:hypothetical protein
MNGKEKSESVFFSFLVKSFRRLKQTRDIDNVCHEQNLLEYWELKFHCGSKGNSFEV